MTNALASSTNQTVNPDDIQLGQDILGIRGPVDIPTGWEWLLYTLIGLIVAALAIFVIMRLLKRAAVIKPPPIPYIAPHALARRRLEAALRLIDDPYRFCSAVANAVRGYVEGRFDLHAPDRTTQEFLDELRDSSALTLEQQELLADFLNQCDRVKFAREEPDRHDLEQLHKFAVTLVEETTPVSAHDQPVAHTDKEAAT
jgi:hypothetical protein